MLYLLILDFKTLRGDATYKISGVQGVQGAHSIDQHKISLAFQRDLNFKNWIIFGKYRQLQRFLKNHQKGTFGKGLAPPNSTTVEP